MKSVLDRDPDLQWNEADLTSDYEDPDIGWYWNDMCEGLSTIMEMIQPGEHKKWHATVENFGWNGRNGYLNFEADWGQEFLRKVLPKTDCTFRIWKDWKNRAIVIDNAHHDKPCGGEIYRISPRKEE